MFYEDAGCSRPCGMEPMGCSNCPSLGWSEGMYQVDEMNEDGRQILDYGDLYGEDIE